MWAGQKSKNDILEYCQNMYNNVRKGRVGIEGIVKRSRLRRSLEEYKVISGGTAGLCYYNQHINPDDPITDSYFFIECSHIDGPDRFILPDGKERIAKYVAVKEMKEFDERFTVDWNAYAQKSIVQKALPIFLAMGWNVKEFIIDENQKSLGEWL